MKNIISAQKNKMPPLGRKSPRQEAEGRLPERQVGNISASSEGTMDEFKKALVNTNMKMDERFNQINETILSLAQHIQNIQTPTPQLIEEPAIQEEPKKAWNPQPSNMLLWDKNENGISWDNHYKGSKIFLVCSGPSLNNLDLSLMDNRGVMSMAMNNSWIKFKPDFWIGFDSPGRFHDGGWMDPSIMKIVPWHRRLEPLSNRVGGELEPSDLNPTDAPNCWFLSNTATFDENTWFTEKHANWGGAVEGLKPEGGFRVSMIGALRTLYYLGFQEVYLLGCDWEMPLNMGKEAYAWEENRAQQVREKNNDMYNWIEGVLKKLQPGFEKANFQVYNCNKHSKLSLFPFIEYEDAIERCVFPELEETRGWYDVPNEETKKQ